MDVAGFQFRPVTAEQGPDLEEFARRYGKFGYCSCMRRALHAETGG